MRRKNINDIKFMKNTEKISALTCYSYFNAKIFDEANLDIILVGDSLGNVVLGYENTLPVEVEDIIYHAQIVERGNKSSLLVGDMPFMSYQASTETAVMNAGNIIKYGKVNAVKLEGGAEVADKIEAIINSGIPVMGHLGLTPQSINVMGSYKVQARGEKEQKKLMDDAKLLEDLGVFAILLECIPEEFAKKITKALEIPTIGIGSGRFCDGQILVFEDIVNMNFDKPKKFVKIYENVGEIFRKVAKKYSQDVKNKKFPSKDNAIK